MNQELALSYGFARSIMREHARTFYFASFWLVPARRRAVYALYGFFRTLDDIVDEGCATEDDRCRAREQLQVWRAWLKNPLRDIDSPLLPALRTTLSTYDVPQEYLTTLIDGLEMDLEGREYWQVPDLAGYCFRVASTVGLAMCSVFGADHPEACRYAAELGVAMQLTNILRDVGEDFQRGRMYLPRDLLGLAGCRTDHIAAGKVTGEFRDVMGELIDLARTYYARGMLGVSYLPRDARIAVSVAAACYSAILDRIEELDYDVFSHRAHLTGKEKLMIAAQGLWDRRLHADSAPPTLPLGAPDGETLMSTLLSGDRQPSPWVPSASSPVLSNNG